MKRFSPLHMGEMEPPPIRTVTAGKRILQWQANPPSHRGTVRIPRARAVRQRARRCSRNRRVDQVSTPEGATPASPAEETSHEPSPPQDVEGEGVGQGSTDGRDSTEPVWDKSENAEVEAGAAGAILITVVLVLLIWLIIRPKPKRKRGKARNDTKDKSPLFSAMFRKGTIPYRKNAPTIEKYGGNLVFFVC